MGPLGDPTLPSVQDRCCRTDGLARLEGTHGIVGMTQDFLVGFIGPSILQTGNGFQLCGSHFVRVEEALELADTGRVTHFAESLGLDLSDALAGDLELATDLF